MSSKINGMQFQNWECSCFALSEILYICLQESLIKKQHI